MAMTDVKNYFQDGSSAITTDFTSDVINLGDSDGKIGDKHNVRFSIRMTTAFSSADTDLTITLQDSANNSDWEDVFSPVESFNVGGESAQSLFEGTLPAGVRQYVRLSGAFTTDAAADGTIAAWIGQ
jgi:hypothetical protein